MLTQCWLILGWLILGWLILGWLILGWLILGWLILGSLILGWLTQRLSFPRFLMYAVPVWRSYTLYKYLVQHDLYGV